MPLRIGRSRLPELLERKRMSQAELARRLGVTEAYISRIISGNGKRLFRMRWLCTLPTFSDAWLRNFTKSNMMNNGG